MKFGAFSSTLAPQQYITPKDMYHEQLVQQVPGPNLRQHVVTVALTTERPLPMVYFYRSAEFTLRSRFLS